MGFSFITNTLFIMGFLRKLEEDIRNVTGIEDRYKVFCSDSLEAGKSLVSSVHGTKTVGFYESFGFEGIDASLEESLFEYGMIWRKVSTLEDNALIGAAGDLDEPYYVFVYRIHNADSSMDMRFDHCFIGQDELESIRREHGAECLEGMGYEPELPVYLFTLFQSVGNEVVFGTPYSRGYDILTTAQTELLRELFAG